MPEHHHHPRRSLTGTITHVFAHRFVVRTDEGDFLADLTPRGIEQVTLKIGQAVTVQGEMKPSELKVDRLISGRKTVNVEHHKKHHHEHDDADPAVAVKSAKAAGYTPLGKPRRKPKHFEVLGRKDGVFGELHIELDGHIRKVKPVDRLDDKWAGLLP